MKAGGPRRLPHILQAIEDLADNQGSSTRRIIDQVESTHYGSAERPKNLTSDVRKALKYAVDNGIVRERAGKFTVANFYSSKRSSDPSKSIFECRRRKKRGGKRRKRRRRRHGSLSSVTESEASLSGDEWETDRDQSYSRSRSRSPQYTSAGIISHRRRKRGGKRRKRRRRGRRHSLNDRDDDPKTPGKDGRCLAHHLQDCDNPGCQRSFDKEADDDKRGSYIN